MAKKPDYMTDEDWAKLDPEAQSRVEAHVAGGGSNVWKKGDRLSKAAWDAMSQEERNAIGVPDWATAKQAFKDYRSRFQEGGDIAAKRENIAMGALDAGAGNAKSWEEFSAAMQKGGADAEDPWMKQLKMAWEGNADPSGTWNNTGNGMGINVATSDTTAKDKPAWMQFAKGPEAVFKETTLGKVKRAGDMQSQAVASGKTFLEGQDPTTGLYFNKRPDGSTEYFDKWGRKTDAQGNPIGPGIGVQSTDKEGNPVQGGGPQPGQPVGGPAPGGGGGPIGSFPGGQGSDIANMLEQNLKAGQAGQAKTFNERAKAEMDGMLLRQRENSMEQADTRVQEAMARGVRGPALEKLRIQAKQEVDTQYAKAKSDMYLKVAEQDYKDRLEEIDRSQKWLDSLRTYNLGMQSNSLQARQIEGQLALGYANIAQARREAEMNFKLAGDTLQWSQEQFLISQMLGQATL